MQVQLLGTFALYYFDELTQVDDLTQLCAYIIGKLRTPGLELIVFQLKFMKACAEGLQFLGRLNPWVLYSCCKSLKATLAAGADVEMSLVIDLHALSKSHNRNNI